MTENVQGLAGAAAHAVKLIAESTAKVDPAWALLGVVLYLVAQAVRTRGWHTIVCASYPEARGLRARDTCCAYLAGSGLNAAIPARGGDLVKLAIMRRRVEGSSYTTLAGTFVPETLFETFFGCLLVAWALSQGFLPVPVSAGEIPAVDVSLIVGHPLVSLAVAAALGLGGFWLVRLLRRNARSFVARFRQGLVILGSPRRFITGVASWQALARLIRLLSLAAFMQAFGLPVTAATVVLVMAAQGGGRIIPLAPASAGLRLAMLSYGFVEVTGRTVDIAAITAFTFGVGALLLVAGLLIAAAILLREFGTLSPRRALETARALLPDEHRRADGHAAI